MGEKGHLTFEKRALSIRRGCVRTPRTPKVRHCSPLDKIRLNINMMIRVNVNKLRLTT